MNAINRFLAPFMLAAALTLGACSGDADTHSDGMDTAGRDDGDTGISLGDGPGVGVNADSAQGGTDGEGIEKLVEGQLILSPGFSEVDVESEGEGNIVLNGTVATAEEKTNAETVAKGVSGVKSVKNNLTVK